MHHESMLSRYLGMRWVTSASCYDGPRLSLDRNHDVCIIDDRSYLKWQKFDVRDALAVDHENRHECGSIPVVKAVDHFNIITDELIVSSIGDKTCLVSYDRFSELALIEMDANQVAVETTAIFCRGVFQQRVS